MVIGKLIDFILHVDKYLDIILKSYGLFTYGILFFIIFIETGFVLMPFLPGDSLIFIAGAFASRGSLNILVLFIVLSLAAILGDSINYWIGNYFGVKVFSKSRFFKKEYLVKTEDYFKRYGGKTIILARFAPFIRTFAPFVAGIGKMDYKKFLFYNIIGGITWVSLFLFGGYYFGKISWVEKNLTLVMLIIIIVSLVPPIFEYLRQRKRK